jgi:5-methylcytosine-specific restriction endonuclease McrA
MEAERQAELTAMYLFKELARQPGARCASCGLRRFDLQVHHVITQQQLKKIGRKDVLWDLRNALVLCPLCHERHTSAFKRIPREKLRIENIDFALELDHGWYLDRMYPKEGR